MFICLFIHTAFTFLDTLAFLPIGLALTFSLLLLRNSQDNQKKIPKTVLIISVICSVYVLGKALLVKDEVAKDVQFEKQKVEDKKEATKELEELEDLK